MDDRNQGDHADHDHQHTLNDAQRAGLKAEYMLHIECNSDQCSAENQGEQVKRSGSGQSHGVSV